MSCFVGLTLPPAAEQAAAPSAPRVWLIGENNPYGSDPEFALYPSPHGCAGWRLCHAILEMDEDDYLATFERRNLLAQMKWSVPKARTAACDLLAESSEHDVFVLCGAKVAAAFALVYAPLVTRNVSLRDMLIIPHPSGRSPAWHDPDMAVRVRLAVKALVERVKKEPT